MNLTSLFQFAPYWCTTLAFSLAGMFGFSLQNSVALYEEENGNGLKTVDRLSMKTMDQLSVWGSVTVYNHLTTQNILII